MKLKFRVWEEIRVLGKWVWGQHVLTVSPVDSGGCQAKMFTEERVELTEELDHL